MTKGEESDLTGVPARRASLSPAKAPAFPFAPESSTGYQNILSSLQVKEPLLSPGQNKPEQQEPQEKRSEDERSPAPEQRESTNRQILVIKPDGRRTRTPETPRRTRISARPARQKATGPGWQITPLARALSRRMATIANACTGALRQRAIRPQKVSFGRRHTDAQRRRSPRILLALALMLTFVGVLSMLLFHTVVPDANLTSLATPGALTRQDQVGETATPDAQTPASQPTGTLTTPATKQPASTTLLPNAPVRIQSRALGSYLYEANHKVLYGHPASNTTASQWRLENFQGNIRIRNVATGDYMSIQDLSGSIECIAIYNSWMSPLWTFQDATTAGYVVIRNLWQVHYVAHVVDHSGAAEYGPVGIVAASAQWKFVSLSGAAVKVTPGTRLLSINAGGDTAGKFIEDKDYNQGNKYSSPSSAIDTSGVSDAVSQAVFQSNRWGSSFTYTISSLTVGQAYRTRLEWAELIYQEEGKRVFNVAINGSAVLSNFDVYATTGYRIALAKDFIATANHQGQIVITFTRGSADNPFISALEIYSL